MLFRSQWYEGLEQITPQSVAQYDIVIVTSAHTTVDYEMVARNAKAVFDTKNAMKNVTFRDTIELL